jgi:hypothetical protein
VPFRSGHVVRPDAFSKPGTRGALFESVTQRAADALADRERTKDAGKTDADRHTFVSKTARK